MKTAPILAEIEVYLRDSGLSAHEFGLAIGNDVALMTSLRLGRHPNEAMCTKIRAYIARNPPRFENYRERFPALAAEADRDIKAKGHRLGDVLKDLKVDPATWSRWLSGKSTAKVTRWVKVRDYIDRLPAAEAAA